MKKELSILIPTYNDDCYDLVQGLLKQAEAIEGLAYEVIVADDASSLTPVIMSNRRITESPCCRFIENAVNRGRSAIRNQLMRAAQYEWLLFIDSDMGLVAENYLQSYLQTDDQAQVVYGGYVVEGDPQQLKGNLRYRYETKNQETHRAETRRLQPDRDFHTSNFFIARDVMMRHPLDERFQHYGYEDVLYGRHLTEQGILIHHIDNPLSFCRFEENADFLAKTEEGLRTLYTFRNDLQGYSRLLETTSSHPRLARFVHLLYRKRKKSWRRNLRGPHPSLLTFTLYKWGYYQHYALKMEKEEALSKAARQDITE